MTTTDPTERLIEVIRSRVHLMPRDVGAIRNSLNAAIRQAVRAERRRHENPLDTMLDRFAVWAVRYTLGRSTYAVADVCDTLRAAKERLRPETRARIVADIDEAIERGNVGMDMDRREWEAIRAEYAQ